MGRCRGGPGGGVPGRSGSPTVFARRPCAPGQARPRADTGVVARVRGGRLEEKRVCRPQAVPAPRPHLCPNWGEELVTLCMLRVPAQDTYGTCQVESFSPKDFWLNCSTPGVNSCCKSLASICMQPWHATQRSVVPFWLLSLRRATGLRVKTVCPLCPPAAPLEAAALPPPTPRVPAPHSRGLASKAKRLGLAGGAGHATDTAPNASGASGCLWTFSRVPHPCRSGPGRKSTGPLGGQETSHWVPPD